MLAEHASAAEVSPEVSTTEYVGLAIEPDEGPVEAPLDAVDIDTASEHLSVAVRELVEALMTDSALSEASMNERQQFAKYLTLAKIKLENAIAVVRAGEGHEPVGSVGSGSLSSQIGSSGSGSAGESRY